MIPENELKQLPRPHPTAGWEAYDLERKAALALDPRKAKNFTLYQTSRLDRRADIDYLPIKLDIENVSRCNFKCTMCVVSTWKKGKRAEDMPVSEFKKLIDDQYGLVEIKLNGLGEALMQGDEYFDMISYARSKRIWVRMTTNASLLHVRDNYKKLIDSGVNEIDISIDGADRRTFESIRVQSDFDQVVENCKLLNGYAWAQGKRRAKMWTLVQASNFRNLPAHVDLGKEMGFNQCVFSLNLHGWGHEPLAKRNAAVTVDQKLTYGDCVALIERGASKEVFVTFWTVNAKFTRENLCPWPFERAVVTSDSRTVPCCMIGDPDAFELGKGKSFGETWKSDEYRHFRQAHLSGNLPRVCKGCYK